MLSASRFKNNKKHLVQRLFPSLIDPDNEALKFGLADAQAAVFRSWAPSPSTFGDAFSGPELLEEEKEAKERKAQAVKEELGTFFINFFFVTKIKKLVLLQVLTWGQWDLPH